MYGLQKSTDEFEGSGRGKAGHGIVVDCYCIQGGMEQEEGSDQASSHRSHGLGGVIMGAGLQKGLRPS